jgi:hypothetical protein
MHMAEQVIVKRIDDITGEEGASLVEFALDGTSYELDLTEGNRQRLKDSLADFVAAGRKVTGRRGRVAAPRGTAPARVDREQTQAIRDWARLHGRKVSERGRIPELLRLAYDKNDPSLAPAADDPQLVPAG